MSKLSWWTTRLQQQIVSRRDSYQWQTADQIVAKADAIAIEDLNIRGMKARCQPKFDQQKEKFLPNGQSAKRGLNRSISDAAWGELPIENQVHGCEVRKESLSRQP